MCKGVTTAFCNVGVYMTAHSSSAVQISAELSQCTVADGGMGACVEGSAVFRVQGCRFTDAHEVAIHAYGCADIAVVCRKVESCPVGIMVSGVVSALSGGSCAALNLCHVSLCACRLAI